MSSKLTLFLFRVPMAQFVQGVVSVVTSADDDKLVNESAASSEATSIKTRCV